MCASEFLYGFRYVGKISKKGAGTCKQTFFALEVSMR